MSAPSAAVGDPTQLLHIDVDQRPGVGVLVAVRGAPRCLDHDTGNRVEVPEQWNMMATQHPTNHGRMHPQSGADEDRTATGQFTHDPHSRLLARPGLVRMGASDTGTVMQPRDTRLPEPPPPPPRRRAGETHLRRDMRDRTPRLDALDHDQPAGRSQPGISVRQERPPCVRAEELDSSNSTPEVSPTSTTIRVSTASVYP